MRDWLIWQLADSAFPTGGFAHSAGLEAAWQQGEVDAVSLPLFVRESIAQAAHGALPFVTAAHADPASLDLVDRRFDVFLRNPVTNRASRVQGRAWLGTVERAFPTPQVRAVCDTARSRLDARHHAPLYGAILRALDVECGAAERLYLFGAARLVLSAGVRLGIVGTHDAQRLLGGLSGHLDATLARCSSLTMDDASQTAPLIDLWQSAHDRLYSRLFQS